MDVKYNYTWEAEFADNWIVTKKQASLENCKRMSFRPTVKFLPPHDIVGVPMIRRFATVYNKIRFNDSDRIPEGLKWENGSNIVGTFKDLRDIIIPLYLIRQCGPIEICPWCLVTGVYEDHITITQPYTGRTAKKCNSLFKIPRLPSEYVHCVVGKGWRFYLRCSDGTVIITPEGYPLNI